MVWIEFDAILVECREVTIASIIRDCKVKRIIARPSDEADLAMSLIDEVLSCSLSTRNVIDTDT